MQKIKRILPVGLMVIWDIISVILSIIIAFRLSFWYNVPAQYKRHMLLYIVGVSVVMLFFNTILGSFNRVWRTASLNDMLRQLLSVILGTGVLFLVDFILHNFYNKQHLPPEGIIILSMLMLILMSSGRFSVRFFLSAKARLYSYLSTEMERVIIYGAGEAGTYLLKKTQNHPDMNLKVMAFIDDDRSLHHRKINDVIVYGAQDALSQAIDKYEVTQVIVAIPTASRNLLEDVLDICRVKKCKMRRFGNIDESDLSKVSVSDINLEELLRRDSVHLNMSIISQFIQDKVVLVTGGAGSIGSEICRQVLSLGCEKLIIFDIHENGLFFIDNELKETWRNEEYSVRLGSIRDRARLAEIMREFSPHIVFHAAAHKHVPMMEINPCEAIKNNVMGTINTAQVAVEHGVEKFILISTDKAVNPTNIMGASKRITEMIVQMMDKMSPTDFAAVRFGNVLGSNGSVVPFFRKQIAVGGPVTVTHPEMRRYFMTIPEAVQLVLEAGAMANGGEIFVLDMGKPVKIFDLAKDLIRLSGYEPDVDIKIVYTGLRPGEKLFEEISLADEDVTKTPNSKIVIMKPVEQDPHELAHKIKELEHTVETGEYGPMLQLVKGLVPTFHHKV